MKLYDYDDNLTMKNSWLMMKTHQWKFITVMKLFIYNERFSEKWTIITDLFCHQIDERSSKRLKIVNKTKMMKCMTGMKTLHCVKNFHFEENALIRWIFSSVMTFYIFNEYLSFSYKFISMMKILLCNDISYCDDYDDNLTTKKS